MSGISDPTIAQFRRALDTLGMPGGSQQRFLRAHYKARGRAATTTQLARAAKYRGHTGVNLRYGMLANQIGRELGMRDATLELLCDFDYQGGRAAGRLLVMKPRFAAALEKAGWLD
jgi:hypothetical protein